MPANIGNQTVTVKFFDPVDSDVANRIGIGVRKKGIYEGGYLTKVNDTTVSLSTYDCEIGDGIYQVRGYTGSTVNIGVASATPYVILRWVYTGSASDDYIAMLAVAVGSITANDLVVGKCNFTGSTLTGFDYTLRSTPSVFDLFLKAQPTSPASMYVRVRAGRVSYGATNYDIIDQQSPLFTAPSAGLTRKDLLQVNTSGALIITQGTPVALPSTPAAPDQGNLVTLAQITLVGGQTTITTADIKDTRSYVATNFNVGTGSLVPQGAILLWSGSIATIPTGWNICDGTNGTPNLTDRFVLHADGVTNAVGATGGAKTHTLSIAEMPAHSHTYQSAPVTAQNRDTQYSATWPAVNSTGTTSTVGGSGAHNNRDKYYALAYIMKL